MGAEATRLRYLTHPSAFQDLNRASPPSGGRGEPNPTPPPPPLSQPPAGGSLSKACAPPPLSVEAGLGPRVLERPRVLGDSTQPPGGGGGYLLRPTPII